MDLNSVGYVRTWLVTRPHLGGHVTSLGWSRDTGEGQWTCHVTSHMTAQAGHVTVT